MHTLSVEISVFHMKHSAGFVTERHFKIYSVNFYHRVPKISAVPANVSVTLLLRHGLFY